MPQDQTAARLEALERAVAQLEKATEELSDLTREQDNAIETLQAEIQLLGRQILSITEGEA